MARWVASAARTARNSMQQTACALRKSYIHLWTQFQGASDADSGPATLAVCIIAAAVVITFVWPRKPKSTGAYDPATGLGRGAPGFRKLYLTETNVKRIALPADIVARIRAGEQVSAEEITAAQNRAATGQTAPKKENEWLPDAPKPKSRRGRKK